MYRTDFWILWKKARVRWSERTASKHVDYQVWNRSPAQVGFMRQVLGAGALGWPRGMGWGGRWEGVSGWGTHVNPRLIHVNVWQKPLPYCKVISLLLIKIIGEKKERNWYTEELKHLGSREVACVMDSSEASVIMCRTWRKMLENTASLLVLFFCVFSHMRNLFGLLLNLGALEAVSLLWAILQLSSSQKSEL